MHSKIFEKLKLSPFYYLINPIFQRFEVLLWIGRGKTPPTPHLIKQSLIKKYAKRYGLKTFIETGTYLGVMIDAVKNSFEKIYTIEIDKKLYKRAKKKFENNPRVFVVFGDSGEMLKKVVSELKEPALFWLDAHYSRGITGKGKAATSVVDELNQIMNRRAGSHVVLIDDANLFTGHGGYPSLREIKKIVNKKDLRYKVTIEKDVIILIQQ